jgi:hypothetical protein
VLIPGGIPMSVVTSSKDDPAMHLLLDWAKLADSYGTWEKGLILHALVKMNGCRNVLEIGTGPGICAFCIAAALKARRNGRLLTIDDGSQWKHPADSDFAKALRAHPQFRKVADGATNRRRKSARHQLDQFELLRGLRNLLGLDPYMEFARGHVDVVGNSAGAMQPLRFLRPALRKPLDLLFVDYQTGIFPTLRTLATFLPLMADHASIFFDSESTWHPSFLVLERTIEQLNAGKLPAALLSHANARQRKALDELARARRFQLVHVVDKDEHHQNSLTWLRIEPVDAFPYPLSKTRGLAEGAMSGAELRNFIAGKASRIKIP